ncbi:MAG: TlpA family protein disulfide reductase [Nitrospira sp.]|jgi:peroxiredoxin|nr:TlpA family protein disulfide reductase [Nitrospira sp.]MDH4303257.1 TlpA family protein disulfide reductase [Nitrospira sp.]MDH5193509.1 TlpA family protein disulfide reductase [Nitrospira sp.]
MKYIQKISPLPVFLVAGVLVMASVVGAQPPQSGKRSPVERGVVQVGDEAPNFMLRDLAGNVVSLSQLRGKVVLLNFWATWCGPCRVEMPAMEQLYRTVPRGEFEILAVSTDAQGAAVTRPFQKRMGFTFPILHDSEYRVGLAYGARTIPITFMVDRHGVVRQKIFGARDWDSPEARDLIQALMKS